jgi:hypothetical protein
MEQNMGIEHRKNTLNDESLPSEYTGGPEHSSDYESTPAFSQYLSSRYEASFDKSRLISANEMHTSGRKLIGMEDSNE